MPDFFKRRVTMVDTQVRPSDVTKFPIIDALLATPREAFVPEPLQEAAYLGEDLDLGDGRALLAPRTFAKMLDAVNIQPDELVLDIGCLLGYSTAVIGRMAEAVVAVDSDLRARDAERLLSLHNVDNAAILNGPLNKGAERHGPYDVILIEGGVQTVPDAIIGQLKDGGRIAALFMEGALGVVRVGYKLDGGISWRDVFNAAAPILPGFEMERTFVL
ncbi:protein-L-isoaspartate O-methyltransferase family protein [Falsirhodobacter algicola]|uniref:Protein-L-isoaspartate O-methyltransferase n=1 Tax=Falsirhodobacter algicola TaxID=2692330 RepID=A0A8J8SKI1_9RHOB|nr:protein-L-isoaspartate O-methyltransferase [Falsirhodobacter algicola]QUS35383.1 protein-L-isoaspartate O-methyltransferase [Falsirhodobacter algicola]